jgi:hypothetical protein
MELVGVIAKPSPPGDVIRSSAGDERPEARTVAEHPEMSELVDDDRLEGLGWRKHEAPAERQPAGLRRAAPAAPGIADGDPTRSDAERRAVDRDRRLDAVARLVAEPVPHDGVERPIIAARRTDDELSRSGVVEDGGPAGDRRSGSQRHEMVASGERDQRPAAERSPGNVGGLSLLLGGQMATDPSLPRLDEIRGEPPAGGGREAPAARDRDDRPPPAVDDDPDVVRPRRAAQRVGEGTSGKRPDDGLLDGLHSGDGATGRSVAEVPGQMFEWTAGGSSPGDYRRPGAQLV